MLTDVLDECRAENRRLTAALESIANNSCCGPCLEAGKVARAALGGAVGGWQPIATAPVSTTVLVYFEGTIYLADLMASGAWVLFPDGGFCQPTQWQPLPSTEGLA